MKVLALTTVVIAFLLIADRAGAQGSPPSESLELTIRLMPEGATSSEAVTKTIVLPPAASATGVENSQDGVERANEARESRGVGQDRAAEARERGREFGQQMSEQARENRDEAGHGNPDRPRPNPPGPNPPGPNPPGPPPRP